MKFEFSPTLVLTKEELATLDSALKLCRDMDEATSHLPDNNDEPSCCDICPKRLNCSKTVSECVFVVAHKALKEIIDMAVIKWD